MSDPSQHYPKRPEFFANYFVRVMAKACLANEIGSEACWLITVIALTEDAKRYREPVTFFNEQLLPLVGIKNVKALDRIRAKAVESGWLKYAPGGKSKPGRYWVDIPTTHQGWDNAPSDEKTTSDGSLVMDYSETKSPKKAGENREESGEESGRKVGKKAGENRERSGQHSSLSLYPPPDPTPSPESGGGAEQQPIVGPKPPEVTAFWNSHSGLMPCADSDPHRDRMIRSWATTNALWIAHWRGVIGFMGRTPLYCGGGRDNWRATLGWVFKNDNFTTLYERMIAEGSAPTRPRLHQPNAPVTDLREWGRQKQAELDAKKAS